jgi:hypothetical protein
MHRTPRRICWLVVALAAAGCDDVVEPPLPDASADADADVDADADADADADVDADADADADVDADADADADADGSGTWDDPIVIGSLPFSFVGDTREAPAREADTYAPCAASTDESGGEYLFELALGEATRLRVAVDDVVGDSVDIDVHVLDAPSPDACVARDNMAVVIELAAGTWWIAADTWVNASGVELAGPFELTVAVASDPGDCLTSPIECVESDTPAPSGVPTEAPGTGGCPAGMTASPDGTYCIDRYEAMLVEVLGDGTLAPFSPYVNPGATRVRALSVERAVPQGYITQVQAAAACAEAGKRLCTDDEWLLACQGAEGRLYPHGGDASACNTVRECHPAIQYFETTADWIWSELGNPCLNQLPDGLAPTGDYAGCVSPEGVYDLVGNLHEWTADPAGTFRGGFYVDALINGTGCLYRTTAHDVSHWDYSTGFRCCSD